MEVQELMDHLKAMELHAVVCTDQHVAFGPFETLAKAAAFSMDMSTEQGECDYFPVPFILLLDMEKVKEVAKNLHVKDADDKMRGYL